MSVVVVVTAIPVPEHRTEVIRPSRRRSSGFMMNRALNFTRYMKGATDWS